MSLSSKSLQVLTDLKRELLSRVEETPAPEPEKPKREEKPRQTMRHARVKAPAFQRYCQRGGRW